MYLVYRLIGVDIELSELYQFYEKETQWTLPRNTRVILYIEIRNNQSYSRYQVFCHLFYEQNSGVMHVNLLEPNHGFKKHWHTNPW